MSAVRDSATVGSMLPLSDGLSQRSLLFVAIIVATFGMLGAHANGGGVVFAHVLGARA